MRIAIVYDCLYPHTIGGAERWYRELAERLCARHSVTYLTRRQWGAEGPGTPFTTQAVAPGGGLYTRSGRRRIWPPLLFGAGVFLHLLRHGRRYDVVHSASFPYFSLIGAALALRLRRSPARLVVDWHEVWGRDYWRSYLGPLAGRIGFAVERACLRLPDLSFTFSRLAEGRLRELGQGAPVTRLTGEFAEDGRRRPSPRGELGERPPLVVFAGRHIPEKRVTTIPPAIAAARRQLPEVRCLILGDGPRTAEARANVEDLGLRGAIEMPGRVAPEMVARALAGAACLLHPSEREGYGQIVVEAASVGTPVVVVAGSENAATELVQPGVNGLIAETAEPRELGKAVVKVIRAGGAMRESTAAWYERHRKELSIESSLDTMDGVYGEWDAKSEAH